MYDESGQRIKFTLERINSPMRHGPERSSLAEVLKTLQGIQELSWEDSGKSVGNLALRVEDGILISRSGREPSGAGPEDFVKVVSFDKARWHTAYASDSPLAEPSSDTPLHWASLVDMPRRMRWARVPVIAIHGHDLNSGEIARAIGCPISTRDTEFSTPADLHEFELLLTEYPYPKDQVFIRRNHGFFVLGDTIPEAVSAIFQMVQKAKKKGLLK